MFGLRLRIHRCGDATRYPARYSRREAETCVSRTDCHAHFNAYFSLESWHALYDLQPSQPQRREILQRLRVTRVCNSPGRFDDETLLFNLELRTGLLHHWSGDLPAARQSLDAAATRSAAAMAASSSLIGYDPECYLPGERGWLAQMEGRTSDALTLLAQGIDLARQRSEQEVLGWLLGYATLACLDAGDLASARRHAQECLEVAQRVDNPQNHSHAFWAMSLVLMAPGRRTRRLDLPSSGCRSRYRYWDSLCPGHGVCSQNYGGNRGTTSRPWSLRSKRLSTPITDRR